MHTGQAVKIIIVLGPVHMEIILGRRYDGNTGSQLEVRGIQVAGNQLNSEKRFPYPYKTNTTYCVLSTILCAGLPDKKASFQILQTFGR